VTSDARSISIAESAIDAMVAHARRDLPHECCGLLVGTADNVDASVAARNIAPTPATRYEVDPREHIALNRELRGSGHAVIGVYHSHPRGPARPSPSDVADAFYPDFIYVIVSLADPLHAAVGAFEIRDGRANQLTIANPPILRSFRSS
jgi:desampylase